jgi:hypothetical protein
MLFAQHTESGVNKLWNMLRSNSCVNTYACFTYVTQFSYWWAITDDNYSLVDNGYGAQEKVGFAAGAIIFRINSGF